MLFLTGVSFTLVRPRDTASVQSPPFSDAHTGGECETSADGIVVEQTDAFEDTYFKNLPISIISCDASKLPAQPSRILRMDRKLSRKMT